jgi:hypothetical protein
MIETEIRQKLSLSCPDLEAATKQLNNVLFNEHQQELLKRRLLRAQGGEELVKAVRPFEITDDCNSDQLCHCFKDVALSINDQERHEFKTIEKPVEVKDQEISYHVFFTNGDKIIDPTFGQFLRMQKISPEKFRKSHQQLFINNVFVGSIQEAQQLGIRYGIDIQKNQ